MNFANWEAFMICFLKNPFLLSKLTFTSKYYFYTLTIRSQKA